MKKLLLIFALSFSTAMSSSPVRAEWTQVSENSVGNTFYVDFERIRKHDGYVYWWELNDNLTPTVVGDMSAVAYRQGDCELFRYKALSYLFYKLPMGKGNGDSVNPKVQDWQYPPPNSPIETILMKICSR